MSTEIAPHTAANADEVAAFNQRLRMFKLLCRGGMDGWKLMDRTLWWLQRPPKSELRLS